MADAQHGSAGIMLLPSPISVLLSFSFNSDSETGSTRPMAGLLQNTEPRQEKSTECDSGCPTKESSRGHGIEKARLGTAHTHRKIPLLF